MRVKLEQTTAYGDVNDYAINQIAINSAEVVQRSNCQVSCMSLGFSIFALLYKEQHKLNVEEGKRYYLKAMIESQFAGQVFVNVQWFNRLQHFISEDTIFKAKEVGRNKYGQLSPIQMWVMAPAGAAYRAYSIRRHLVVRDNDFDHSYTRIHNVSIE